MQSVRSRGTVTEVITLPAQQAPQHQEHIQERPIPLGPGAPLGTASHASESAQPLSTQKDLSIRVRLAALRAKGMEQQFDCSITQMLQAPLSQETHNEVETWVSHFRHIDPRQREERALSLGTLIFRILRPTLLESKSRPEQELLFRWEDACRQTLRQILPPEGSVEQFLQTCEIGLQEEALFKQRCERAELAMETQIASLDLANETIDAHMENRCAAIQARMIALQARRREMNQTVEGEVAILIQEIDHLKNRLIDQARQVGEVGREDEANKHRLEATLNECRATLERLL